MFMLAVCYFFTFVFFVMVVSLCFHTRGPRQLLFGDDLDENNLYRIEGIFREEFNARERRRNRSERGLRTQELHNIKLEKLRKADLQKMEGDASCSICCEEFKTSQRVRIMPECKHTFHQMCIDKWLSLKPRCPNCNRNLRHFL